jgi:hypothetical protein
MKTLPEKINRQDAKAQSFLDLMAARKNTKIARTAKIFNHEIREPHEISEGEAPRGPQFSAAKKRRDRKETSLWKSFSMCSLCPLRLFQVLFNPFQYPLRVLQFTFPNPHTRQPARRKARFTTRSRVLFPASLRRQKARLFAGFVACLGQPCQKQPSTKIAVRDLGKTKSGRTAS